MTGQAAGAEGTAIRSATRRSLRATSSSLVKSVAEGAVVHAPAPARAAVRRRRCARHPLALLGGQHHAHRGAAGVKLALGQRARAVLRRRGEGAGTRDVAARLQGRISTTVGCIATPASSVVSARLGATAIVQTRRHRRCPGFQPRPRAHRIERLKHGAHLRHAPTDALAQVGHQLGRRLRVHQRLGDQAGAGGARALRVPPSCGRRSRRRASDLAAQISAGRRMRLQLTDHGFICGRPAARRPCTSAAPARLPPGPGAHLCVVDARWRVHAEVVRVLFRFGMTYVSTGVTGRMGEGGLAGCLASGRRKLPGRAVSARFSPLRPFHSSKSPLMARRARAQMYSKGQRGGVPHGITPLIEANVCKPRPSPPRPTIICCTMGSYAT